METIMSFLNEVPAWVTLLLGLFATIKTITPLLPSRSADGFVDKVLIVLNWLALNVGKDKNADQAAFEKAKTANEVR